MTTTRRNPREKPTNQIDLNKPMSKEQKVALAAVGLDCFGKVWEAGCKECSMCADSEVCSIIFNDTLKSKSDAIEKEQGVPFLDKCDFDRVDKENLLFNIDLQSGHMEVRELVDRIKEIAQTGDDTAVIEWIKRWKLEEPRISIKAGIVYYKKL